MNLFNYVNWEVENRTARRVRLLYTTTSFFFHLIIGGISIVAQEGLDLMEAACQQQPCMKQPYDSACYFSDQSLVARAGRAYESISIAYLFIAVPNFLPALIACCIEKKILGNFLSIGPQIIFFSLAILNLIRLNLLVMAGNHDMLEVCQHRCAALNITHSCVLFKLPTQELLIEPTQAANTIDITAFNNATYANAAALLFSGLALCMPIVWLFKFVITSMQRCYAERRHQTDIEQDNEFEPGVAVPLLGR